MGVRVKPSGRASLALLVGLMAILAIQGVSQNRPTIIDAGEVFQKSRPPAKKPLRLHSRPKYIGIATQAHQSVTSEVGVTIWQVPREGPDLKRSANTPAGAPRPVPPASADAKTPPGAQSNPNANSNSNAGHKGPDIFNKKSGGGGILSHPNRDSKARGPVARPIALDDFERAQSNTLFSPGDSVRLTVEVPRAGFLYVIDREKYQDGSAGDPYLIFPTRRTNGGDNRVSPGRLVEIPSRDDHPPFLVLASKPGQIGELLTLIITTEPIAGLPALEDEPLKLSIDQFSTWEKKWGGPSEKYEMVGGPGNSWTSEEKAAGEKGGTPLTSDAPLPQTVYRVSKSRSQPLMIQVPLLVPGR